MLRDAHARQSINYITDPINAANWVMIPASKSTLDREIADFVYHGLVERHPWRALIRRIGRGYGSNGFHLEEVTDDFVAVSAERFPNHPNPSAALLPTGFHERPAFTVNRWWQSKRNPSQLAAIEQYLQGGDQERSGFVTVPSSRLMRWTWDQTGADFEGLAILRSAYGPWKIKNALLVIDAIRHERYGVGTPVATLPEESNDEDEDALETALAEFRSMAKGYLMMPWGSKLELPDAPSSTDINEAIQRCNIDMAVNVAGGFMLLGLTGSTGSYALGSTQQGAYHLAVESHANFIADGFNVGMDGWSIVDRIVDANYGPEVARPRLMARNLPTKPWLKIVETTTKAAIAGLITPDDPLEELLRESMDLGPHDPTTARERPTNSGTPAAGERPEEPDDEREEQTNDESEAENE